LFCLTLSTASLHHATAWAVHANRPSCRHVARCWVGPAPLPRNHRWPVAAAASSTEGRDSHEEIAAKFMLPKRRRFGAGAFALVRAVLFLAWFTILGSLIVPCIAIARRAAGDVEPHKRRRVDSLVGLWSMLWCWPFFRVQIIGKENLPPPDQACVYVANHNSFMDILSAFYLRRSFKFISKASIFKLPLVGYAMRSSDHLGLDRDDPASQISVFKKAIRMLKAKTSLFIFPEATRSKTGKLLKFKALGPFKMAKRVGVPIVPITILGSGRIMPSGKEYLVYRSGAGVQIIIHPMISEEDAQAIDADKLVARTKTTIASALPPEYRGDEE